MTAKTKKVREVPHQNYTNIKLMYLPHAGAGDRLFTDLSFPPDQSSLTYVYSGDDRYEHMIFKRPNDLSSFAVFAGVGGVYDCPFPWNSWRKGGWFSAAVAVVSLSVKKMSQLIPGYKQFEQSFQTDYVGAFHFNVWRFDEWVDIVVDDHLPTINNNLLYCPAHGEPREFWAPLVEKAYAKCKKTYEAIECGKALDALTDLTGVICEFYTPDVNPPGNIFHILYKSCVNRSQIVCWRNDKRLTSVGFMPDTMFTDQKEEANNGKSFTRYLHIVTAITKFPLADGRIVRMVRLKCPHRDEPEWNGKFSDRDNCSWANVNLDFFTRYKPLTHKEPDEYWMTLEDFQCNFGGLILCSGAVPYKTEGMNVERCYRRPSTDEESKPAYESLFARVADRRHSGPGRQSVPSYFSHQRHAPTRGDAYTHTGLQQQNCKQSSGRNSYGECRAVHYKEVKEHVETVKIDNTISPRQTYRKHTHGRSKHSKPTSMSPTLSRLKRESKNALVGKYLHSCHNYKRSKSNRSDRSTPVGNAENGHMSADRTDKSASAHDNVKEHTCNSPDSDQKLDRNVNAGSADHEAKSGSEKRRDFTNGAQTCVVSDNDAFPEQTVCPHPSAGLRRGLYNRSSSIISTSSVNSECCSTFSASDINVVVQSGTPGEHTACRRQSAPSMSSSSRQASQGSLKNMTSNNFLATLTDNFRSHGSWRIILEYTGTWECHGAGSLADMKVHERNPRLVLHILHADAVNEIVAPCYHGKSHVIISLLQDYRHGACTANSLLVPIGFCIYKCKNPSRDEKRTLSKLSFIDEAGPSDSSREVNGRFDLEPGNYFIVPYCLSDSHSGKFLLRALAERDPVAAKTGW